MGAGMQGKSCTGPLQRTQAIVHPHNQSFHEAIRHTYLV